MPGVSLSDYWFVHLLGTNKYLHLSAVYPTATILMIQGFGKVPCYFKEGYTGALLFSARELNFTKYMLATGEVELVRASSLVPVSEPINAQRFTAMAYEFAIKYTIGQLCNLFTYPYRRMKKKWSKPQIKQLSIESIESLENQISTIQHRIKILSDNYLNDPDGNASRLDEMIVLSKELTALQNKYAKILKQKKYELTAN